MEVKDRKHITVGIDEVGRGPLAGPVAVAVVAGDKNHKLLKNIKDSKKLSAKQREEWEKIIRKNFKCCVATVGPRIIDRIGISKATRLAVNRALRKLSISDTHSLKPNLILLDGLLKAPKQYNQKTIIKGDEKIPLISAASVIAKTYRDRKMVRFHNSFPEYGFNRHKGYGTKLHYRKIKKHGVSIIHRKTYLKRVRKYPKTV